MDNVQSPNAQVSSEQQSRRDQNKKKFLLGGLIIIFIVVVLVWVIISFGGEATPTQELSGTPSEEVFAMLCDQFPERLSTCTPFVCESIGEDIIVREIYGLEDGLCVFTEENIGVSSTQCFVRADERVALAVLYHGIISSQPDFVGSDFDPDSEHVRAAYEGQTLGEVVEEVYRSGRCIQTTFV